MADWRDNVVTALVQFGVGEKIIPFQRERVYQLMQSLAESEKKVPKDNRIGFLYCLENYEEKGINTLLNKAESLWPFKDTTVPLPPEPPLENPAPKTSIHTLDCVVAIRLDNPNYEADSLMTIFRDYFVSALEPPFCAIPIQVAKVHDSWYDIYIRYSVDLMLIYELIKSIPWIKDVVTKPKLFFARRSLHTLR